MNGRLVSFILALSVVGQSHLLLEVNLLLGVVFLTVLQLLVSLVNQVVTGGDVVVTVVFDAFLSVLRFKFKLCQNVVVKLLFYGHFLFSWKQTHVSVSVLHLESPSVASDVVNGVPGVWIGVQNVAYQIFALTGQELREGVVGTHDLLIKV